MKNNLFFYTIITLLIAACAKPKGALVSPSIDFTYAVDNANPAKYNFTNISKFANGFVWYFGDGDSTKTVQTTHTYKASGTYNITLKAFTDDGVKKVIKTITVAAKIIPTANFNINMPKPFLLVANGTFINQSLNAISYKWSFGDGGTSISASPMHEYITDGTFNVRLAAYSSTGDSNIMVKQISIKSIADSLIITKAIIITTATLQYQMYDWDFSDDPDYLISFGNWIDTSKKRTHTIWNSKAFPLDYNLQSKPIVLPVAVGFRTPLTNPITVLENDVFYENYVDDIGFTIANYIKNPNAYPDEIIITGSTAGETTIKLIVKWK